MIFIRKFCLILCVVFLLNLCGCTNRNAPEITSSESEPVSSSQPQIQIEEPTTDPKSDAPLPAYIIVTKYYSITIPDEWESSCTYEIFQMDNGLYSLGLYEKTARDEFGGGKLCSIQLMNTDDDTYLDFPNYELLGVLKGPEVSLRLIALYPTDVQFSENAIDAYTEMSAQIRDVLITLSPAPGIEMVAPAPAP